jgi:hypothetical protein
MSQLFHHADAGFRAPPRQTTDETVIVTTRPLVAAGRRLAAGSTGVIIDVSPVTGHYHAEFSEPFHCVLGLDDGDFNAA